MTTMNKIKFSLNKVEAQPIVRDGISFSNVFYIDVIVDGKSLFNLEGFKDSFIVYDELIDSLSGKEKYLLFTCACGVADDGGWNGVLITKETSTIRWIVQVNDSEIHFTFDLSEYNFELTDLKKKVESINKNLLEPKNVEFPEEW